MTKPRLISSSADNNSIDGSRLVDGSVSGDKLAEIDSEKLSYQVPYSGGQKRTVEERLSDYVNVKDFGAKGDGTTDDSDAILAALAWANTQLPRKSVYIPDGDYRITKEINQCHPYGGGGGIPVGSKQFGIVFGSGRESTRLLFENVEYAWTVGSKTGFANLPGGKKGVYFIGLKDLSLISVDTSCKHGLWIGGTHFGIFSDLYVDGFTGDGVALYGNYAGGGTGTLWNTLSNVNVNGPRDNATYLDSYAFHVYSGANANYFSKPFFNSARYGIYAGGGRNVYAGVSGETQPGSVCGFALAGQCLVTGMEIETTGGTGVGDVAFIVLTNSRSSIHDAKFIGYNTHVSNESGVDYPEVSFIDSTYESPQIGLGPLFQNFRLKPILDRIVLPSRLLKGEATASIAQSPGWTVLGQGNLGVGSRYSGNSGYFSLLPQRVTFTRDDDSGFVDIQVSFTPFSTSSDYSGLGSMAPGETSVTFSYQDFVDKMISQGHIDLVISPSFRARRTASTDISLVMEAFYLVTS